MSKKNIRLDTPQQKEMYKMFCGIADKYGKWEAWSDFIRLSACSLCLSDKAEHEAEYADIVKRYGEEDMDMFAHMLALTVEALEENPNQDFLGDLFMRFDLSNTWKGQFFTPYSVCEAMTRIASGDLTSQIEKESWIPTLDPACGAGALLIAFAHECMRQNVNYQQHVLFVGQDIDRTAALMCFVQLSLLGCPGYVVVGDSIANPVVGKSTILPSKQPGQEIWYTPMMYTSVWQMRIAIERIKNM